jgi:hypothetical protein
MTGGRDRTAPWRGFRPGGSKEVSSSPIDAIVGKGAREGARRMRAEALQGREDAYIVAHVTERNDRCRRGALDYVIECAWGTARAKAAL